MDEFLRISNLSTDILTAAGSPLTVVDDVSLTVERGEIVGIVGESGSGKTIFVRSIMGLLPAAARVRRESSQVVFDGTDLVKLPVREVRKRWGREITFVPQDPMTSLNPVRKIGVQLTDGLRYHGNVGRRAARERGLELLRKVGIADPDRCLDLYPHQMSGGMRQRVLIAMAVSMQPKLLIADEPTTALDVTVQKQILDLLDELRSAYDMSIVIVSHDLAVVSGFADRILVMYAGKLVEDLPGSALTQIAAHPYTVGLLRSHPDIDMPARIALSAIPGEPPDLAHRPGGCGFAPRCSRRLPRCEQEVPVMASTKVDGRHLLACFNPVQRDTDGRVDAPGAEVGGMK